MAIANYSTTPASNTTISGTSIAEGCAPSGINDAIRQMMADIATDAVTKTGLQTQTNKLLTEPVNVHPISSTGSANAYVYTPVNTSGLAIATLTQGMEFTFKANFSNTDVATLAYNGLDAKNIYKHTAAGAAALAANDIRSGDIVKVVYDGTQFQLLGVTSVDTSTIATAVYAIIAPLLYPIGSIYTNETDSTNPATLLGFTSTWVAYGAGRNIVGVGTGTDGNGDTLVVAAAATGGEYNHVLTSGENAAHKHFIAAAEVATQPASSSVDLTNTEQMAATGISSGDSRNYTLANTATAATVGLTSGAGSGTKHNNTSPWVGAYMWKRTA